jgi:hypothetical protein
MGMDGSPPAPATGRTRVVKAMKTILLIYFALSVVEAFLKLYVALAAK